MQGVKFPAAAGRSAGETPVNLPIRVTAEGDCLQEGCSFGVRVTDDTAEEAIALSERFVKEHYAFAHPELTCTFLVVDTSGERAIIK